MKEMNLLLKVEKFKNIKIYTVVYIICVLTMLKGDAFRIDWYFL